ncbi:hypothetical protein GQR58_005594 [Nymphon striatum]|nr:hypothetical protein GQR58_005594 [Nymphon striatum]
MRILDPIAFYLYGFFDNDAYDYKETGTHITEENSLNNVSSRESQLCTFFSAGSFKTFAELNDTREENIPAIKFGFSNFEDVIKEGNDPLELLDIMFQMFQKLSKMLILTEDENGQNENVFKGIKSSYYLSVALTKVPYAPKSFLLDVPKIITQTKDQNCRRLFNKQIAKYSQSERKEISLQPNFRSKRKSIILSLFICGAMAGNLGGCPYGACGNGYPNLGYGYGGLYQKVRSSYGNTAFAYNDGSSTRQENIAYDGSIIGSYSVRDADGTIRTVKYRAGKDGFQILGEDGSVKEDNVARAAELAAQAAELAKAAPQAPEVPDVPDVPEVPEIPEVDLPVAPTNPPDYGKRNENVYEARKTYYGARNVYGGYGNGGYGNGYGYGKLNYGAGYGYAAPAVVPSYGYNVAYKYSIFPKSIPEIFLMTSTIILSVLVCGALASGYGGYGYGAGYGHGSGYGHGYGHGGHGYGYGGLYQKVSSHHGNTKFAYNDGRSTRQEHIAYDGSAHGSYSVQGADGKLRTVNYRAGRGGFEILGDDGSVKEDNVARAAVLAEQAAELAKAAPTAVEAPEVALPVAPTNPPDYGKRNEHVYEARKKYYGNRHNGYGGYGNGGYGYGAGYGHGGYGGYGRYGGYGGYGGYGYGSAPASYGYSVAYAPGYARGHGYGGYGKYW